MRVATGATGSSPAWRDDRAGRGGATLTAGGAATIPGLPLRGCLSEFVSQWGWGPLPQGTEQLLRDILQTLRNMGLQYTLQEQAETETAETPVGASDGGGEQQQQLQRITLKIHFSTQGCTGYPTGSATA